MGEGTKPTRSHASRSCGARPSPLTSWNAASKPSPVRISALPSVATAPARAQVYCGCRSLARLRPAPLLRCSLGLCRAVRSILRVGGAGLCFGPLCASAPGSLAGSRSRRSLWRLSVSLPALPPARPALGACSRRARPGPHCPFRRVLRPREAQKKARGLRFPRTVSPRPACAAPSRAAPPLSARPQGASLFGRGSAASRRGPRLDQVPRARSRLRASRNKTAQTFSPSLVGASSSRTRPSAAWCRLGPHTSKSAGKPPCPGGGCFPAQTKGQTGSQKEPHS